jgi:hypothetical protein
MLEHGPIGLALLRLDLRQLELTSCPPERKTRSRRFEQILQLLLIGCEEDQRVAVEPGRAAALSQEFGGGGAPLGVVIASLVSLLRS